VVCLQCAHPTRCRSDCNLGWIDGVPRKDDQHVPIRPSHSSRPHSWALPFRPAKTSPGPWDGVFADVRRFVDEVLAELIGDCEGGTRRSYWGHSRRWLSALRKAVMAKKSGASVFCGMQCGPSEQLRDIPFNTDYSPVGRLASLRRFARSAARTLAARLR